MLASRFGAIAAAAAESGPSAITLASIDAWAVDAASGGTIASASGGTMPTVVVDVDPTPYVDGASGTKADWTVQFQGALLGSWTRLGNGDFRYTPGVAAGLDEAEFRVSDDGGSTWSEWAPISIEVVARPPGPFFLVENYAGTNQQKVQAALDGADAAGGTATTLQRAMIWDDVNQLNPREAHLLGVQLKRSRAVHSSGDVCGQNVGSSKCTGWSPPDYFDRVLNSPIVPNTVRQQIVLCTIDGNSAQQPLRETTGDNPTPSSPCGTCYANAVGNEHFNLQRQAGILCRGNNSAGASNRRNILLKRSRVRNTCGDGMDVPGSADVQIYDSEFIDCFRGGWTLNGGNTVADIARTKCLTGAVGDGTGIDYEPFGFGGTLQVITTVTDCEINDDFDCRMEGASDHTFTRCICGPGNHWLGGGNSICRHIDGEVRFHVRGGGSGDFPREAFRGVSDRAFTVIFDGTTFVAWGLPYVYHGVAKTPVAGQTWQLEMHAIAQPSQVVVHFINVTCTSHQLPAGSNTVRVLNSTQARSTADVVRLDGVTIGAEYVLDAFRLNGQTCEYRNVVHQGFPGTTIQDIAPGAGAYVAL